MLRLWGRATSSNVQAVMWGIGELELSVERIDWGGRFGGWDEPAFRAMNPMGLVTVLRDGEGAPLFESAAILRYLAGRYVGLWPEDPEGRAQVDVWAEWASIRGPGRSMSRCSGRITGCRRSSAMWPR